MCVLIWFCLFVFTTFKGIKTIPEAGFYKTIRNQALGQGNLMAQDWVVFAVKFGLKIILNFSNCSAFGIVTCENTLEGLTIKRSFL